MTGTRCTRWLLSLTAVATLLLVPALLSAADRPVKITTSATPTGESVEMFDAIRDGKIEVQLIPKDSTECNVIVKNRTDKPLSVKLPDVFAGVPVLAQGGFGGGMGGMGGGFFNVPPERVGQIKAPGVCLEHGKKEPRPGVPYKIVPIDQFTDKAAVHEIGRMLGTGAVNQRAAQVATWHLQNGMTWEQLAAKQQRSANGASRPYFSPQEIEAGMQIVVTAANLAERRKSQEKSQPQSSSVSQN